MSEQPQDQLHLMIRHILDRVDKMGDRFDKMSERLDEISGHKSKIDATDKLSNENRSMITELRKDVDILKYDAKRNKEVRNAIISSPLVNKVVTVIITIVIIGPLSVYYTKINLDQIGHAHVSDAART